MDVSPLKKRRGFLLFLNLVVMDIDFKCLRYSRVLITNVVFVLIFSVMADVPMDIHLQ